MPEYNAVQVSRLEKWVRKVLGVRNPGIVPTVAPELGVALNLPTFEDTDLLAGYQPWGGGHFQAAVAGEFSVCGVANQFLDQLVIVRFRATSAAADAIYTMMGPAVPGALGNADRTGWRDSRRNQASFPLTSTGLEVKVGTTAVAFPHGSNKVVGVQVSADSLWTSACILAPGGAAFVVTAAVNKQLWCGIEAQLRAIDPDELSA